MKEYSFKISDFKKLKLYLFNKDYREAVNGINKARNNWSKAHDKEGALKKIRLVIDESEYEILYASLEHEMDEHSGFWNIYENIKAEIEFSDQMSDENRKELASLKEQQSKKELESI